VLDLVAAETNRGAQVDGGHAANLPRSALVRTLFVAKLWRTTEPLRSEASPDLLHLC
jgi:hypothetical protein